MNNVSSKLFDPPDEPSIHYLQLCLLAPCTVNTSTCWFVEYSIRPLILVFWVCFLVLCRIYPRFSRIRTTDLLFYAVGIGAKPALLSRRELLVLILYGLTFTSVLNLLEAQQMAFVTVLFQGDCFKSVQEVYGSNLRVILHPDLKAMLVTEIDPTLQERIVMDNFSKVNLSTKQFAYMIGCEAARTMSQAPANHNPELDLSLMAVIEEPVATIGFPIEVEEYIAETGILEQKLKTIAEQYYEHNSPISSDSPVDHSMWYKICIFFGLFYSLSIAVFGLEMVFKVVRREMVNRVLIMIRSMKSLKRACLEKVGKRKSVKRKQIAETVQK